jgi:hypothetical protein
MEPEVKDLNGVLRDIIAEAKRRPYGWKSVLGRDDRTLSEDICLFHPEVGVYQLKRYSKSPFEFDGVGAKVAKHIDDLPFGHTDSKFEILQVDIKGLIDRVLKAPDPIDALMRAQQAELNIDMLVSGPVKRSDALMSHITESFPDHNKLLRRRFQRLTEERFGYFY